MAPRQGLELGLLIGADHILVGAELDPAPEPLVELEHPGRLDREVRVPREDPRPVLPGLDRVLMQPPPYRRGRHRPDQPLGDRLDGQLRGAPPRQRHLPLHGRFACHCLDLGHHLRSERPRPSPTRAVFQAGQARLVEPLAPHADHIDVHVESLSDPRVLLVARGQQHDLGPDHRRERRGISAGTLLQHRTISRGQHDHIRGVGAENSVTSCDLHILVDEAAESDLVAAAEGSLRRAGECGRRAGADQVIGAGGACCSCATRRSVVSLA